MSIAAHHTEWLSLIEVSGPFLSLPVLMEKLPQGLEAHDPDHLRELRQQHEKWEEGSARGERRGQSQYAWIKFVLGRTLELEEFLFEGQAIPQTLQTEIAEHGEIVRPNFVVKDPATGKTRLLVAMYPPDQNLEKPVADSRWKASPDTRMAQLLHDTGVRLGLVTNGDRWMLVDAPKGETAGFASWYASLWLDEKITLQAFRTLLSANRFFNVADDETLEALLAKSAANQQDVTDQLGSQVRKAVEVLIQSLDRSDQDHGRKLLGDVREEVLYEASLTIMMRLVFLFCAEERDLLLLGDPLYDQHYSVSTIRKQLRETADQFGEEILERRHDAWCRLLVTFRAVYAGVEHDDMKLPAYGGRLFDPDRFAFLEGRKPGTTWHELDATPLPVNNRTVLHLLEALQLLQVKVPGSKSAEPRRLSFRALDIEQIGHVYEGLLDHTAVRASEPFLGLAGAKDKEPEVSLAKLEELAVKGDDRLVEFLAKETGRSAAAVKKGLEQSLDGEPLRKFETVIGGDRPLWDRMKRFAPLVRLDSFGYPVVITRGSIFVTEGTDRRSSGTHYTPRSLTEPIVQYTLEPLVYVGPAEGWDKKDWKLKSARELLDLKICDMACGSGAFLVQACRYMAERLLEAWEQAEKEHPGVPGITPNGDPSTGQTDENLIPTDLAERQTYAMRLVAQRCLYGVDKNPLAVEMAKLSLWLLTLAKDKPFEFLDHAIRPGDSLVGIHDIEQLKHFSLEPDAPGSLRFQGPINEAVEEAIRLRLKLESTPANTTSDVEAQERLLAESDANIAKLKCAADLLVSVEFSGAKGGAKGDLLNHAAITAGHHLEHDIAEFRAAVRKFRSSFSSLTTPHFPLSFFHWPLEFPEVLVQRGGFDAIIGNPPFVGGRRIRGTLGEPYLVYLTKSLFPKSSGNADLCAFFFRRAVALLRQDGGFGLLATNTISQGDSRSTGLDVLHDVGCSFFRAKSSEHWPGTASLEVSHVWGRNGKWAGTYILDEKPTPGITSFLTAPGATLGKPHRLAANAGKSFQGSIVLGMGFVLEPKEAQRLIDKDPRNKEVLFPYLNGEDLNSRPDQSPSRWVINFFDWSEAKAREYPDCFRIVEEKVKPERTRKKPNGEFALRKPLPQKWWIYADKRPELYRTIAGMDRVITVAATSRTLAFAITLPSIVFSHATYVFAMSTYADLTILQSCSHETWARNQASSMKGDLRYTPSDCFETFPFPESTLAPGPSPLETIGSLYHDHRRAIMLARQEGLTKTYNRFHNDTETSADIAKLRQLHAEMDNAVAAAYGWTDFELGHGFHETKQGIRFTISEPARREVLDRLLTLNHERYAEEEKQGLHGKKKGQGTKSKGRGKSKGKDGDAMPLLDEES